MPSTHSTSVPRLLPSSTVITPSLPTFSMALASMSPISRSPFEAIVPTWAISSVLLILIDIFLSSAVMSSTAFSMPSFICTGLTPAATERRPSLKIACARMVAVVVPSPATSLVLEATSFTIWAPMFSYLSESSTSFATVTPSFVTSGEPNDFSMITFRPRGPSVTLTASVRMSTPILIAARASASNFSCLAIFHFLLFIVPYFRRLFLLDHREDVFLPENQMLFAIDLDVRPRILAEKDAVPRLDLGRHAVPAVGHLAGAHRHHQALLRLLLRAVGDDDPPLGLRLLLDALEQYPVLQRPDLHGASSLKESNMG